MHHFTKRPGIAGISIPLPMTLRCLIPILIPAHNEAATIATVVRRCLPHAARVIVLADHCTDDTVARARSAGAEVWENPAGLSPGKATTLCNAWARLASDPSWTHLLLLDGDGQHDPDEAPKLLAFPPGIDLVIGSRAPFARPMPPLRRAVNRIMSRIMALRTGLQLDDSQSGFRRLSRRLVEQGTWTSRGFELESEMILQAARLGFPVAQVPVACQYGGRSSHIRPWTDTFRWLLWLGRTA
ncbi:MAG: glycosyltransferase family 2 protein [Candidatus Methylacidiphilales bacterium]|nr:glycosyltransferase family 2 protein [Candidatus Methylacidiphilales bacterium]